MRLFRFVAIPEAVATEVRRTMRSPQYGHPAYRELASGYGPCRHCLRTFRTGAEDRILFTYQPFEDEALPAPGPVYIHAAPCPRHDALGLPPDFRSLPLVFEGYSLAGRLVMQERVGARIAEGVLAQVFADETVHYAHVRNGEAGCFMARVEPCLPDD